MSETTVEAGTDIPQHPEEMKTNFNLRIGKSISMQGSARITPAGIVTAGITICFVAVTLALVTRWRD